MPKIKCIAFVFFVAIIVRIESRRGKLPATTTYKAKSYDVTPGNDYLEKTGEDSITWKQTINYESKVEVWLNYSPHPIAFLCDENQDQFLQQAFKVILGNDKPCPFEKGLTSNVFREYKRDVKVNKGACEPQEYKMHFKVGDSKIMSLDMQKLVSGEACA